MLGEEFPERDVVAKILRSLAPNFKHVVSSIIEAKDLSKLTVEELGGSLKGHESMLTLSAGLEEQTALHASHSISPDTFSYEGRGRGRGSFNGRFCGRGRGRGMDHTARTHQKPNIQCFICKKFGHTKAQCWYNETKEANVAEEVKTEEPTEGCMFMVVADIVEGKTANVTNIEEVEKAILLWLVTITVSKLGVCGSSTVDAQTTCRATKRSSTIYKRLLIKL